MTRYAEIAATGCYVPELEVSNDTLKERFPEMGERIDKLERSSGIRTRWYAPRDWATSDLAVRAARQALERARLRPEDVQLIVLGTDTPDYITPATSTVVQHKLGATNAGTFDVGCACASFPTAVAAAAGMMTTTPALRNVLVIGAYRMSRLADENDFMTFFYGDGAGAAVLRPSDEPGIMGATFRADGQYASCWGIFSGGTAEPASEASVREGRTQVRMLDKLPNEVNDVGWPTMVRTLSSEQGFELDEIDLLTFTQVRRQTIERVMDDLGVPRERTHMIMDKWGYTGSACIPMALHDAVESGRVSPGQLHVLVGSGVGYNQAAVALRITEGLAS